MPLPRILPDQKAMSATSESARARLAVVLRNWLPVLACMALIFVLSSQPSLPRAPDDLLDTLLKKGAHFGEYVILAILVSRALFARGAISWRAKVVALGIAVAYAVSDELHQGLVPGRTPSPWDVGIDAFGAIVGITLFVWWARR